MAVRPDDGILTNLEVLKRYRFDKEGISFLEDLLQPFLQPQTARHQSMNVREKILITLRYLATDVIQLNDADIHNVAQSTVSRVVTQVVSVLSSPAIIKKFICFPTRPTEIADHAQEFHGLAQFPRVMGVIDGTHIRIVAPSVDEDAFVNRKGFHSINVQLVFGAFDQIIDCVARWPGSTHDSRILNNSGVRQLFDNGMVQAGYHLLGDSGYPCRRWLLTPYLNPQPGSQSAYNRYIWNLQTV